MNRDFTQSFAGMSLQYYINYICMRAWICDFDSVFYVDNFLMFSLVSVRLNDSAYMYSGAHRGHVVAVLWITRNELVVWWENVETLNFSSKGHFKEGLKNFQIEKTYI